MQHLSTAALVKAAKKGDKKAFGILIDTHLSTARMAARQMVSSRDVANELVQEATLQAYLSLDSLKDPAKFHLWLLGIVRNICRNYLRSLKIDFDSLEALSGGRSNDEFLVTSNEWDPPTLVEFLEQAADLDHALEQLSPKARQAARLFYFEQLRIPEIASQLNCSVSAVKSRLFQARQQLRKLLASDYAPVDGAVTVLSSENAGNINMIKVTQIHVLDSEGGKSRPIFLLDSAEHRYLPIWIGSFEAHVIAQALSNEESERPLTFKTFAALIDRVGGQLEEVRIEALRDNTFYAVIKVQGEKATQELDARPSDAIALALHTDTSIFIADEVMEKAGRALPTPFDEAEWIAAIQRQHAEQNEQIMTWQKNIKEGDEIFTKDAQSALNFMLQAAKELNHQYVGTEHLLLGLTSHKQFVAAKVLSLLGVEHVQLKEKIKETVGEGAARADHVPQLAPRVAQVFDLAAEHRRQSKHKYVGTEHLLLGILGEEERGDGKGMALSLLKAMGVASEEIHSKLLAHMGGQ